MINGWSRTKMIVTCLKFDEPLIVSVKHWNECDGWVLTFRFICVKIDN